MKPGSEHGEPSELAALYTAGALPESEAREYEQRMAAGCPLSNAESAGYSPVVERLVELAEPVEPPPRVRDALLARIHAADDAALKGGPQIWRQWEATSTGSALYTMRRDEGTWDETGVTGVRIRRLFVDRQRNQFTGLVRMAPGTAYPRHVHDGPEECLVLEGDLSVGDEIQLAAGDYQYAPPGSLHGIQSTRGGCLL
jgi:quercetin dioxygenase-like cupin family protein